MAEIFRCRAGDVDAHLEAQLLELTLPTGDMAKVYRACANPTSKHWEGTVIVARDGDQVVGWALRWRCFAGHRWSLHIFVDPARRRTGIGSQLVAASRYRLRATTELRGFVWDDTSASFWATIDIPGVVAPDLRRPAA